MSNITGTREQIFERKRAQRIIIKLHIENLDSQDYRFSAYKFVNGIFPNWENDKRILFLALKYGETALIWPSTSIAMSTTLIRHTKTQLSSQSMPLWQHRRRGWVIVRWPQEDEPLAAKLADLHIVNGFDVTTPFLENYNAQVVNANPREF
jgi:hypothetical protein